MLTEAYLDKITPKRIYQEKMSELKGWQAKLSSERLKLEACLVQKENSLEYQHLLKTVIDNFDATKKSLTALEKKELMRLIFKRISIENRQIIEVYLYEPFQTMLDEINGIREIWKTEENQQVTRKSRLVSQYAPSDAK